MPTPKLHVVVGVVDRVISSFPNTDLSDEGLDLTLNRFFFFFFFFGIGEGLFNQLNYLVYV